MPFDGAVRDWEPPQRPRVNGWYVVIPCGQRQGRKKFTVEIIYAGSSGRFWPLVSFYAASKRQAYGLAAQAVGRFLGDAAR